MANKIEEPTYNKWALITIGGIIGLLLIGLLFHQAGYTQGYDVGKKYVLDEFEGIKDELRESNNSDSKADEDDYSVSNYTEEDMAPPIDPIELSGYGNQETRKIPLKSGLYDLRLTHNGTGNFAVWLVNGQGTKIDLIVNEIGTYDKLRGLHATNDDDYTLEIMASGSWTATISRYTFDR